MEKEENKDKPLQDNNIPLKQGLKRIFIHLGIALIVGIVLVYIFINVYLPVTTQHGETISVPDLSGMTYKEAVSFLESRNLRVEIFDSTFVPGTKPMTIISQNPQTGSTVKDGRKVYITVTPMNAPKVALPNIIDFSAQMAEKMLRNNGLSLGKIQYKPDLAENAVLETWQNGKNLKFGDSVFKGTTIDLIVGDGRGADSFIVPKLIGLTQEEAEYTILGSGLSIGIVEYIETDTADLGVILKTEPSHERKSIVRLGDPINIWISGNNVNNNALDVDSILNGAQ